jgi:hypothetical protein
MASETDAGGQWERVAVELRACRDSQQRAWGDIDNATLGRYLAGEADGAEREQVERALEERPELRKLTDLVRDVLRDFEPGCEWGAEHAAPAATQEAVPAPAVLPFPRPTPAPKRRGAGLRRRSSLVAAACLLLTFGLLMPRPSPLRGPEGAAGLRLGDGTASLRPLPPFEGRLGAARAHLAEVGGAVDLGLAQLDKLDELNRSADDLAKQQRDRAVVKLAHNYTKVAEQARRGLPPGRPSQEVLVWALTSPSREEGEERPRPAGPGEKKRPAHKARGASAGRAVDLARAETTFRKAHAVCQRALGPEHPTTVWMLRNQAGVYQVALSVPDREAPARDLAAAATADAASVVAKAAPLEGAVALSAPGGAVPGVTQDDASGGPTKERGTGKGRPGRGRTAALALRKHITNLSPAEVKASVVPVLEKALRKAPTTQERAALASALGELGPVAGAAVPALTACFQKADSEQERRAVLVALCRMGPAARHAVPTLLASLKNQRPEDRRCAADALAQVGRIGVEDGAECFSVRALGESARVIQGLAQAGDLEVRVETVRALGGDVAERGRKRAREMGPRAVYVLAPKDGGPVQVYLSDVLRREGLAEGTLAGAVQAHFLHRDYDKGLCEVLEQALLLTQRRAKATAPAGRPR